MEGSVKVRVEQIRQRRERQRNRPMLAVEGVVWDDVDFLLSLVKSQEAGGGNANGADAIVNQFEALRTSASLIDVEVSYQYLRGAIIKAQSEAATSMRSACIEKLRERAGRYKALADASLPNDQTAARTAAAAVALNSAADELESLSIEQPKE